MSFDFLKHYSVSVLNNQSEDICGYLFYIIKQKRLLFSVFVIYVNSRGKDSST